MNSLWRTPLFSDADCSKFKTLDPNEPSRYAEPSRALHARSSDTTSQNWLSERAVSSFQNFRDWSSDSAFTLDGADSTAAILLCPRTKNVDPSYSEDQPAALKYVPFQADTLKEATKKLHVHRALTVVLERGSPAWCAIPCKIEDAPAQVYILRSQASLFHRMALSITYFPEATAPRRGSRLFAILLGCPAAEAAEITAELRDAKAAVFSPFTLIKLFLRIERRVRLDQVDEAVSEFESQIQNFKNVVAERGRGPHIPVRQDRDPKQMIKRFLNVSHLRNGLVAWKTQLERLAGSAKSFRKMPYTKGDIDPRVYLERLMDDYDIRINDCETVMQGASLTFEMETAHQARQDTDIAIRDGKAMKTMALVTMFFLPGTFFATLLAVPEFESLKNTRSIPPWSIYVIMFVPSTFMLMVGYFVGWDWVNKRKLKRLNADLPLTNHP